MSPEQNRNLAQNIVLVLWGMVTLVLLFSVALLVYEMRRQGQDPLAVLEPPQRPAGSSSEALKPANATNISLYFADSEALKLAPELSSLELTASTVENCRKALEALIQGPRSGLTPILSPTTKLHALYLLEDGELVVDFSRDLVVHHRKSASAEALMVYGIVTTVTQGALKGKQEVGVSRVRFLIEGSSPGEGFPAHMDVSEPIVPDARWRVSAGGPQGNE